MGKGRWDDHAELLFERTRIGLVRAATLMERGLESRTIYRRCLPGGPWQRLLPGIIFMQNAPPTDDQKAVAALLYAGPRAVVTGLDACVRHGLRLTDLPGSKRTHVLIPHRHRLQSTEFVTVERTLCVPAPLYRADIPLAPLVRSTIDAVRRFKETEPVQKLLIEAIQRGRCSPQALAKELDTGSQRGTAIPRRVLGEIDALRSVAEVQARRVASRLTVPPSHWNIPVFGADGRFVGMPDAWWDDVALAMEVDSYDFHFSRADYARTLLRNNRYASAGIHVVQVLPSRLAKDPAGVLAEIESAYEAARQRPRPPVHMNFRAAA